MKELNEKANPWFQPRRTLPKTLFGASTYFRIFFSRDPGNYMHFPNDRDPSLFWLDMIIPLC
jgi:hypothetical protein